MERRRARERSVGDEENRLLKAAWSIMLERDFCTIGTSRSSGEEMSLRLANEQKEEKADEV